MTTFPFDEKYLSQIPALQLLINAGYSYLTPAQALAERQRKTGNVLLENILREQLKKLNRIQYRGGEHLFSEENIQSAIQRLKTIKYDGLLRTNELIYDLLTIGSSFEQNIDGDLKSFDLTYIDWRRPERNVYHVTAEFSVDRTRSHETARPDIVLFVNGIPLAVIECKSPQETVEQAVSQQIRNQTDEYIPKLFTYAQLLLGVNKNAALYATAGSGADYWGLWKELRDKEAAVGSAINKPLPKATKDLLFSGDFAPARAHFDALDNDGSRLVTEQDRAIYSLCRPERLLELAFGFTLFDGGIKKIARYQQYFVIKSTIENVKQFDEDGRRLGGIIWHTQGSGKSLTMVMLARNLAFDKEIKNPRIVLVTDRDDLDKQLGNTFAACGLDRTRATSGRKLLELIAADKAAIVTTIINKFDKALNARNFQDDSADIFVLVDESHRTNYGSLASRMRQMLPKACYLGFTGTPLLKKEKNSFAKFGKLIEPHYSINQAVADKAVLPLLYEGRHVEIQQNKEAIDLWFERHTQGLSTEQKADLKKKYAKASRINKAKPVIYMRAFDISEHFREFVQGTGFKAQLVAPSKAAALQYKEVLDEIGHVSSEVVISAPDDREGYEEVDDGPTDEVLKFWQKMMKRYGDEENYLKQIINQFKNGDEPEILIVVSKLLTGFDAPRNRVIYLCKELREHTLLQAIARVNRIYPKKDFGFVIDYAGLLGELDKALHMYKAFEGFDEEDIRGTLIAIKEEIAKLPQRYADLWDIFKTVKGSRDEEAYEQVLADVAVREDFYRRLTEYGKTLALALSTEDFVMRTEERKLRMYKNDLKRFYKLRASVKLRFAEEVNMRELDPKIAKLLDTHLQANEVLRLNEPVDIFDENAFNAVKEEHGVYSSKTPASRADSIAHATKKVIAERMDEDPAFYEKFSKLIEKAIEDFRTKRISEIEYLNRVTEIRDKIVAGEHDDAPEALKGNGEALGYFGVIKPIFGDGPDAETAACDSALAIQRLIEKHRKVDFWADADAQKEVENAIDDFLFDEIRDKRGIDVTTEQMDELIASAFRVAKQWRRY